MTLITPTWQADPPNSGTVQIVGGPVQTDTSEGYCEYKDFTFTASPAPFYVFDMFHIDITIHYTRRNGTTYDRVIHTTSRSNPYSSSSFWDGRAWWAEYDPTYSQEYASAEVTVLNVTADFMTTHTPTDLLIHDDRANGSNLLVYDDRANGTGLLVADY